jgi:hypothetical protein
MKVPYVLHPDNTKAKGYTEVPEVTVSLSYRGNQETVRALVDSGADECVFHSSVADSLNIDLESGVPRQYHPIGSPPFTGYVHRVGLQLKGFNERIMVEVGFSESCNQSLLGQIGFFDHYEIIFRGYEKRLEIKSPPSRRRGNMPRI